jgi:hypothetical protein
MTAGGPFPEGLESKLLGFEFVLVDERTGGPMGSANWRFTNGVVDIEVYGDRGDLGIVAGPRGSRTFQAKVWARILDVEEPAQTFGDHVNFFLDRYVDIGEAIDSEPAIEEKVRDINWVFIKEHLGLDSNARRPGASPTGYPTSAPEDASQPASTRRPKRSIGQNGRHEQDHG